MLETQMSLDTDCSIKTEVIGFSQSYQWYAGKPIRLWRDFILGGWQSFINPAQGFQAAQVILDALPIIAGWQARFTFGADLSKWKDEDFDGWHGGIVHHQIYSPLDIERLIFNVSGDSRTTDEWRKDLTRVINIIREKYPNLSELYLQPVIGGEEGAGNSRIRAVKNQPLIVQAIENIIANSCPAESIKIGAILKLDRTQFADRIGHLTQAGATAAHRYFFDFYQRL